MQCRKLRRISPDSLSVTDSEAESLSKYTSPPPRTSIDSRSFLDKKRLADPPDPGRTPPALQQHRSPSDFDATNPLRSPTFSGAGSVKGGESGAQHSPSSLSTSVKAYRKSLKHHVQNSLLAAAGGVNGTAAGTEATVSPQTMAKAFTRVVARSRMFFYATHHAYDIYNWEHQPRSAVFVALWIAICKSNR